MAVTISTDEYLEHIDNYDGFCLACHEFTSGGVEPDAEDYPCEACEENKVVGTEQALLIGELEVDGFETEG